MALGLEGSELGKKSHYGSEYDPGILFAVPRQKNREQIGIAIRLPFHGVDYWNAYEVSWLNLRGCPQVAVAKFTLPCTSPNIIESKSFKLYLNSFNQTCFASIDEVHAVMMRDLSHAAGAEVFVELIPVRECLEGFESWDYAQCIDELDVDIDCFDTDSSLLSMQNAEYVKETLCSHLLKSNCPITGQPDWASILIRYQGPKINRENLLKYLVSYRNHNEFHEHCVEQIFHDIVHQCCAEKLTVYARYTRRGGLDINPFRSNFESPYPNGRLIRQ